MMRDESTPSAPDPDPRFSRRTLLRSGLGGAAGLWLTDRLTVPATAAARLLPPAPRAKAVIQIWMWGGPSHLDTFDPKPDAGEDYCGPLRSPIATNVDGIRIGELLPRLAGHADKYSIIRSMTHGVNAHETASYLVQTGHPAGGRVVHPSVGAVVSRFKGYDAGFEGLIPPYIVLTQPQGRFSEAGFLGSRYKPFSTGGNPAAERFAVEGVVAEGITAKRQRRRRKLLRGLDTLGEARSDDAAVEAMRRSEEEAYELILGDAGKVFDLAEESDEVRARYGRNPFGQSCLAARRLVERGVPYVTINYRGWDTHKQHFGAMRRMLPELDRGFATLLEELAASGLLDETIVWWGGEFGRTPKVLWDAPWNGGRSHFGRVFSSVVAGGGFRGGHVVGASDARGEEVAERPVAPRDLIASVYELLGIDATTPLITPQGDTVPVLPPPDAGIPSNGVLREIIG